MKPITPEFLSPAGEFCKPNFTFSHDFVDVDAAEKGHRLGHIGHADLRAEHGSHAQIGVLQGQGRRVLVLFAYEIPTRGKG